MIQNLQCFSLLEGTKRPSGNYFIRFCPVSQGFQTFFRIIPNPMQRGFSEDITQGLNIFFLTFSFGASRRTPSKMIQISNSPIRGTSFVGYVGYLMSGEGFLYTHICRCMYVCRYIIIYIFYRCIFNYVLYIYIYTISSGCPVRRRSFSPEGCFICTCDIQPQFNVHQLSEVNCSP